MSDPGIASISLDQLLQGELLTRHLLLHHGFDQARPLALHRIGKLLMKFFFLRNRADAFRAYIISRCIHCNHNLRNTLDAGETACPRCGQSLTHAQQQRAAQHSPTGATA